MTNEFERDIIDLFSHTKGGHVQKYCYNDLMRPDGSTGSQAWDDFLAAAKNYYPRQSEIDLIPALAEKIKHDYDTIIDFGIGNSTAINDKTIPIIKSQDNLKDYVAIDISHEELSKGIGIIQKQFQQLRTQAIQGDFYKDIKGVNGDNRLGLLLGATISNQDMMVGGQMPRDIIVNRLAAIKNIVKSDNKEGSLIVSIDSNPNLDQALDAYNHPAWMRMMTGLMYDIQSKVKPNGNFSPSMWHYAPVIDHDNHVLHQIVSPSIDQDFSIADKDFSVKRGDQFVITNNFKYPLDVFMGMVEEAGLMPSSNVTSSNSHPMLFVEAS